MFKEWVAKDIQILDQRTKRLKGNFVHFGSHQVSNSYWLLLIHQGYKRTNSYRLIHATAESYFYLAKNLSALHKKINVFLQILKIKL